MNGFVAVQFCRMLDALSRRTEPGSVKGIILVDGQKPSSNFKFKTGYVVQVTTTMMAALAVITGDTLVT